MTKAAAYVVPLILIALLTTLFGCSMEAPEDVLLRYLEANRNQDRVTCYDLLSSEDKKTVNKEAYLTVRPFNTDYYAINMYVLNNRSDEILSVERNGSKAEVKVKTSIPNETYVAKTYFSIEGYEHKSQIELYEELNTKYKDLIPCYITESVYQLVKEQDGWKLFFDIRQNLEKAAAEEAAKQAKLESYKPYIEFRAISITKYSYDNSYSIEAEIKNKGTETVSKLTVKVIGLDSDGNPVFDNTAYPVIYLKSRPNEKDLLKPNYTCRLLSLVDSPAPSDWTEQVRFEITEIEFLEEAD